MPTCIYIEREKAMRWERDRERLLCYYSYLQQTTCKLMRKSNIFSPVVSAAMATKRLFVPKIYIFDLFSLLWVQSAPIANSNWSLGWYDLSLWCCKSWSRSRLQRWKRFGHLTHFNAALLMLLSTVILPGTSSRVGKVTFIIRLPTFIW